MSQHPSRQVYSGRIVDLSLETVTLPNGREIELELVRHPGGAAVVAVDDRQRVCLLHQYRYAAGGWLWELPAGKIDDREPPLQTAQRELADEAGITARQWTSLGHVVSSPGVFTEVVHLYLARELEPVQQNTDPDEVLEVHWVGWREAYERARDGELTDGKTVAGILRALAHLGVPPAGSG